MTWIQYFTVFLLGAVGIALGILVILALAWLVGYGIESFTGYEPPSRRVRGALALSFAFFFGVAMLATMAWAMPS